MNRCRVVEHEAVAAERDDDVGRVRRRVAVAANEPPQRLLRRRRVAGDKGDALEATVRAALGHGGSGGLGLADRRRGGRRGAREMKMERAVFVYTTYPSIVEAERAGRALVERRLCACVNILPGMVSYYWWQGAIERGEEVVMIIKTRAGLAEAVRAAVKADALLHHAGHPGDCRSRAWIRTTTPGSWRRRRGTTDMNKLFAITPGVVAAAPSPKCRCSQRAFPITRSNWSCRTRPADRPIRWRV